MVAFMEFGIPPADRTRILLQQVAYCQSALNFDP
jgi:hypothetical protein